MSAAGRSLAAGALVGLLGLIGVILVTAGDDTAPAADDGALPDDAAPAAGDDALPDGTAPPVDVPGLPDRGLHPELLDIDGWLQSEVTSLEELRGDVVAVQFWTFGCSNCKATIPHLQDLYAKYRDRGFEIVGVHAPEFGHEAEVDNVVEAADRLGVTWPIALDTSKRTFHSWQEGTRAFWPRIYLLDRAGHIRYDHIGEGGYAKTDAAVAALLAEAPPPS